MSAIDQALQELVQGKIGRRQFISRATALGASAMGLSQMLAMVDARSEAEAAGLNTLTLNTVQVFGVIDPAIGIDYTQQMAQINFYDTLLAPTPSASVEGRLATSWKASPDARTFTFNLKKGVKFHSGRELTAHDVVYTMQRVLAIGQGPAFVWQGFLEPAGVKALNRYTVEFRLLKPFAPFPSTLPLLFILDGAEVQAHHVAGKYGANGDYGTKWMANHEAGSGPYTLASDIEGTELRMKKFPGYFRGWHPHSIDEVRAMIIEAEATVVSLAKTGVLDMTSQFQANPTYDTLKKIGFHIWQAPTETVFYLKMNTHKAPTDDIHVRRAIALAFDYDTVRKNIEPGQAVAGPLAPIFKDAYNTALPLPKQDLVAAKAELAKSKYARQSPIPLKLTYVSNTPFETQIGLLFNSIMENLGFKVTIQPNPWNRITDLATNVNTTPNVSEVFYGVIYPSPDSMFFVQYDSTSHGTWASMEWLTDPQVDALIAKSRVTVDVAQRNQIYKQIQARIVQDQPDVFMLAQLWRQAVRPNVSGFRYIPAGTYQFYDLKKV